MDSQTKLRNQWISSARDLRKLMNDMIPQSAKFLANENKPVKEATEDQFAVVIYMTDYCDLLHSQLMDWKAMYIELATKQIPTNQPLEDPEYLKLQELNTVFQSLDKELS